MKRRIDQFKLRVLIGASGVEETAILADTVDGQRKGIGVYNRILDMIIAIDKRLKESKRIDELLLEGREV